MTTLQKDNDFDFCMQMCSAFQNCTMSNEGVVSGILPPDFDIEAVEDAIDELYLSYDKINKQQRLVNFKVKQLTPFCRTRQDLLERLLDSGNSCTEIPSKFYIFDEKYSFTTGTPPPQDGELGRYFLAVELINNLLKVSDLAIPENKPDRLVFLGSSKLYITTKYTRQDLRELPGLDEFIKDFISSETHKDQKIEIIKTVLNEMSQGRLQMPVSELFARFSEFKERVASNYALYVSEFSYEKVKSEVVEEKLEAITNLNKVFSDIQNQLLAVPVALILVRGQLENAGVITVKNFIVWLSFTIFTLFMIILLRNQVSTLKAVKSEVSQQKQQLETKYQSIKDRFQEDFDEIHCRYIKQRIVLWIVTIVMLLVFSFVSLIASWFSGFEFAQCIIEWLRGHYHVLVG